MGTRCVIDMPLTASYTPESPWLDPGQPTLYAQQTSFNTIVEEMTHNDIY